VGTVFGPGLGFTVTVTVREVYFVLSTTVSVNVYVPTEVRLLTDVLAEPCAEYVGSGAPAGRPAHSHQWDIKSPSASLVVALRELVLAGSMMTEGDAAAFLIEGVFRFFGYTGTVIESVIVFTPSEISTSNT